MVIGIYLFGSAGSSPPPEDMYVLGEGSRPQTISVGPRPGRLPSREGLPDLRPPTVETDVSPPPWNRCEKMKEFISEYTS